ncbi:hypothetical protein [Clostridium estertheticum]|uniref:Uncharacterized protein n=1 Tax=Clostridium estertheticum TaxID=238834 RepID=A0A5N7IIZ2_9CLOT|nr:hypothetical protein [Clostridium estertheticum]MBU3183543.1 hypothetical protein [Clostridium estertheticum]MCB2338749.1 hypothetical protein [Clostridium estertheticum]MPQ30275.1 hypothetical protein [Clostridium estertheticum]MPQ60951.1 hypothetical protein [Clostridium estertheticum]
MIFEQVLFNLAVKVNVIHSIPGRLRVNIPYAKKIPKEWQLENNYFNVIRRMKGIKDIQFSYVTLNGLVLYDINETQPDQIIKMFYDIAKVVNKYKNELSSFNADHKDDAVECFTRLIEAHFDLINT